MWLKLDSWARKWSLYYATVQELSEHDECNFIQLYGLSKVSSKGCCGKCPTYTLYIIEEVNIFQGGVMPTSPSLWKHCMMCTMWLY